MQTTLGAESSQNSTQRWSRDRQRHGVCRYYDNLVKHGQSLVYEEDATNAMGDIVGVLAKYTESLMKIGIITSKEYVRGALLENLPILSI